MRREALQPRRHRYNAWFRKGPIQLLLQLTAGLHSSSSTSLRGIVPQVNPALFSYPCNQPLS